MTGGTVDLSAITGGVTGDAGVEHGERLIAFANAVMGDDEGALAREREALRRVLSPEQLVDVCAVIGAFNVVDRIADATGIALDPMLYAASGDIREDLGLARFRSAANTPNG